MPDFAVSDHAGVQEQLGRLGRLSPGADILGLDRIERLLARIGDPHRAMPPVFHVAGTNGKGSTCAFLRTALEAAGYRVHAYASPHLVRFNERIRLAGRLIDDEALAALLSDVLDRAEGIGASFFEVTTAAAFLAFARNPADACVIEVGLGGRLDATNVVTPIVCGIAQLGIDHQSFLGDTAEAIAAEKAGIAKPGVPLVTMCYAASVTETIAHVARLAGASLVMRDCDWSIATAADSRQRRYVDSAGEVALARPALEGSYQTDNLGLAVAMLRHQSELAVADGCFDAAATRTHWPARMQRLSEGPLVRRLPLEQRRLGVWLDGAHNVSAAAAIADSWGNGLATAVVIGMLANKDADGVLRHIVDTSGPCTVIAIPVPGHDCHAPARLAELAVCHGATSVMTAQSIQNAFDLLAQKSGGCSVLVAGSLYLAGEVLRLNEEYPD